MIARLVRDWNARTFRIQIDINIDAELSQTFVFILKLSCSKGTILALKYSNGFLYTKTTRRAISLFNCILNNEILEIHIFVVARI